MRNLVIGAILFIGRVGAHFAPKTTLDVFATRGLCNRKKRLFCSSTTTDTYTLVNKVQYQL